MVESESVILDICEAIAKTIVNELDFEDMDWFYHQGEITPSNNFPALLVEPQDMEFVSGDFCAELNRKIKIALFLREEDARETIRMVHYFVENLVNLFYEPGNNLDIHENISLFKYFNSTGARTCYLKKFDTGQEEFVAHVVDLYFDLEYVI